MALLDYSLLGEIDRLLEGNKIRKPRPVRELRGGQWRRDPAGEFDWYYQLPATERAYVSREYMAANGAPIDALASNAGYGVAVDAFADDLVAAIRAARSRRLTLVDPDGWNEETPEDDDELLGPAEVADLLNVKRNTLAKWRERGKLPEPYTVLSGLPIWRRGDVMAFVVETGREVIDPDQ